jgi:phosphoadenosine phosphosulfate reductase
MADIQIPHETRQRDFDALNAEFADRHALDIIDWAVATFDPYVALSSSFGADSAVMLHLCTQVKPDLPVITVDTGFLFPETIAFRDKLAERLGLNLKVYRPRMSREEFVAEHGQMWRVNPDACCAFNKREPFERAKEELGLRSWLTGVRREQSKSRKDTPFVQRDFDGLIKICPIADWTAKDVHYYLAENDLPYHPLRDHGYLSIGCQPEPGHCTVQVKPGEDPRAGRWAGFDKTECGLHTYTGGSGI